MTEKKKTTMNCREVNELLSRAVSHLERGTAEHKQAAEMINAAGKYISLAKQELAHHDLAGTKPPIGFFGAEPSSEP